MFAPTLASRPPRQLLAPVLFLALTAVSIPEVRADEAKPPNFIVIFCDDMGYGDIGSFGHPTIHTPRLDQMAVEGQRWTQFYVAASVCTPSRAGLLTGRLPNRMGLKSSRNRVLFPNSRGGLPATELTIAGALGKLGYATHCVGKWHLGHLEEFLPTNRGFDTYYGIPYSNDMDKVKDGNHRQLAVDEDYEAYNVPLMRGTEIIERPADQRTITMRYAKEAVRLIKERDDDQPFFIYLAHSLPHIPLFRSEEFKGISRAGIYGDVIEEIDYTTGMVIDALKEEGIDKDTLVLFTSDNGPWLVFDFHGGISGPLREGKGTTWEGGFRVPTIIRWPGNIPAGQAVMELGATLDLLPTFVALAGGELPDDRVYDGHDISPTLLRGEKNPRDDMLYYRGDDLYAVRLGSFKAHFITQTAYTPAARERRQHDPPLLFHLDHDPGERHNVASDYPEVIEAIRKRVAEHKATLEEVENQLDNRGNN